MPTYLRFLTCPFMMKVDDFSDSRYNIMTMKEADAENTTPKTKPLKGKVEVAHVTLLDGSILDVTIEVRKINWILFNKTKHC